MEPGVYESPRATISTSLVRRRSVLGGVSVLDCTLQNLGTWNGAAFPEHEPAALAQNTANE